MARTPTNLANGELLSGSNTIFTASKTTVLTALVLTNTASDKVDIDVYLDRGTSRLLHSVTIPANKSKKVTIIENIALDSTHILKITSSATSVNYDLSSWVF